MEKKQAGWIYGYTNFFVDLTGKVRIGEENELLVEADNSLTPNSRWYSGSGIYRPVNLWTGGPFPYYAPGASGKDSFDRSGGDSCEHGICVGWGVVR